MGVLPGTSHAKANVVLVWPETKKPIEDGGRITLGEFFRTVPNAIPQCEAYAPATLQVNGKSVDDVSARAPTTWYECGAVRISGGFTQVELSRKGIMGIAQPPLAISEPGPCVYDVDKVRGSEDEDELAGFQVTGEATLKRAHGASHCAAEKQLDGVLGLYGPQSGGVGLLPWKLEQTPPSPSLEALEQYWADIGAHNFSAAYTYLALGTSAFSTSSSAGSSVITASVELQTRTCAPWWRSSPSSPRTNSSAAAYGPAPTR
jgi:hypothetical protein